MATRYRGGGIGHTDVAQTARIPERYQTPIETGNVDADNGGDEIEQLLHVIPQEDSELPNCEDGNLDPASSDDEGYSESDFTPERDYGQETESEREDETSRSGEDSDWEDL
jgi:hypothetical protein